MYKYIVQNGDASSKEFRKYNHISEMEKCVATNSYNDSSFYTSSHVYRIKDLMDAINTSVIIDGPKKENYIQMLSSTNAVVNADSEFVGICHDLGECDIM